MGKIGSDFQYEFINKSLEYLKALVEAAEAHGIICGFICSGSPADNLDWLEPILGDQDEDDVMQSEQVQALLALHDFSRQQLEAFEFNFTLLLPSEEMSLRQRSEALSAWCQGLLAGLALSNKSAKDIESPELQETLNDLVEVTWVDYDNAPEDEEGEAAFADILEYVRMATLLIHSIINTPADKKAAIENNDRVH